MSVSFRDFYIVFPGHPRFNDSSLIEDDIIRVIIQKYEMLIFTNKGDLLMDPDFGADLYTYLYETKLSSDFIENIIREQIEKYIEELNNIDYELNVEFFDDPERHQEFMVIYFKLNEVEVYAEVL